MDQIKIGKFIAESRRKVGFTQMQLAEKLNVTDRAVSKWENGKSMPDSSIMLDLCHILQISVTELLKGEKILMEERDEKLEQTLLDTIKQKEEADKRLLTVEIVMGVTLVLIMLAVCLIAAYAQIEEWLRITLIVIAIAPLVIAMPFMIKIEQTAGYYHCEKCGHKYVPKYKSVFMAMHMGRTRYMKCPNCGKKSWQKKTVNKD